MAVIRSSRYYGILVTFACMVLQVYTSGTAGTYKSWCYSDSEITRKTIACNNKDAVISVIRAFAGKSPTARSMFCDFPIPTEEHCLLSQAAKTDDYRKRCNTFNTCSFDVDNPPTDTCGAAYTGTMYLFIEFTCQPVADGQGNHYPIIDSCRPGLIPQEAPSVMLYNNDYPTYGRRVYSCSLAVWSAGTPRGYPTNTSYVKVTFRDLAHDDMDNLACPYSLQYGMRGERMCALRGSTYMTVRIPSGSLLQFQTNGYQPVGRFWIQITADMEGGRIRVQYVDQDAQYPTTPTTTSSPTSQSFHIFEQEHPTTEPTMLETTGPIQPTLEPGVPKPTDGSHLDMTTKFLLGGSTGSVDGDLSTRGSESDQFTVGVGDFIADSEMDMGIKIIIGGAVAGAVIVLLVVVCVAICVRRRKNPVKHKPDLGYMVHANMALADKLQINAGSLRHPVSPQPRGRLATTNEVKPSKARNATARSSQPAARSSHSPLNSPPPIPIDGYTGILGANNLQGAALRHSARPSYRNAEKRQSRDRKSHNRKSTSHTTLNMVSSSESIDLANKAGVPYAVSGVFAGFPRWVDNPRSSGAEDQYDMFTSTLPAKLNKKPMPLPKPQKHHTTSTMSLVSSGSPTPHDSSTLSFDFGTARSTDALYAVPDKSRKKTKLRLQHENVYANSSRI